MKHCKIGVRVSFVLDAVLCLCTGCQTTNDTDKFAPPEFSHETGSYAEQFTLTVVGERGTVVRYTLDGSMPTEKSRQ